MLDLLIHLAAAIVALVFIVAPLAFTVAAILSFIESQRRKRELANLQDENARMLDRIVADERKRKGVV